MLFCMIYGSPALTIFFKDVEVLQYIVDWVQEDHKKEEDEDQNEIENQDLRRIYFQLACHETGRKQPRVYLSEEEEKRVKEQAQEEAKRKQFESNERKGIIQKCVEKIGIVKTLIEG